jgi:phosphatidylserine synthase
LLLLLACLFDMLDGPAARRWRSSRWGARWDAGADFVSFGLAPASAQAETLRGCPLLAWGAAALIIGTVGRRLHRHTREAGTVMGGGFPAAAFLSPRARGRHRRGIPQRGQHQR